MAKYRVALPKPSAKRMLADRKLIVTLHPALDLCKLIQHGDPDQLIFDLSEEMLWFEFEVSEEYAWIHSTSNPDISLNGEGKFSIESVYRNSTGSREEKKKLVPEKL